MTQHLHGAARQRLLATVRERYEAGATIRDVAAEVGYSYAAVRQMLITAGVTLRPKRGAALSRTEFTGNPLAVACPRCGRSAGNGCLQVPGIRPTRPHLKRIRAAAEAVR